MACAFKMAADGELRCLPRALGEVYYAGSCTSNELVWLPSVSPCAHEWGMTNGRDAIFRRTMTPTTVSGGNVYFRNGASCSPFSVGTTPVFVAEEIPSSRFVSGKITDEPRSGGMVARFVDGADGSRLLVSVHDTARNTQCDFDADPTRCLPPRRAPILLFSNSGCTQPIAAFQGTTPPDLLVQTLRGSDTCPVTDDYYAVGAALAPATPIWRRDAGGGCVSTPPSSTNTYYARGAAIAVTSFPAVKTKQEGSAPIQVRRHFDSDDRPLGPAFAFWDPASDREGEAAKLSDGSLRFVPKDVGVFEDGYFSDTGCMTSPLGSYHCATTESPYVRRIAPDSSCHLDYRAYDIVFGRGAQYIGPLSFTNTFVPCETRQPVPGRRYYNLGPVVPPSTFPELHLRTE
jgi:hypothetical protein